MAIRVPGSVVIDDNRNFANVNSVYFGGSNTTNAGLSTAGGLGAVRKYARGQLVWTLNNPNAYSTSQDDQFGGTIAMSGNYAIVGAYQEDDTSGTDSGKAYIFNVTTGQLLWTLNNPNAYDTSANDYFASSLAISGNYAIVGAYAEDDSGGFTSGKAYIYNVTTGQLLWTLNNPNPFSTSNNDQFGGSVSISGNYAIVGAYVEADGGKAYIYNVTTGQLLWTLDDPNVYSTSIGDSFGWSVGISDNYVIVGAWSEDDTGGGNSGKAYIYNVTTGQLLWTLNNPNAYDTTINDYFGGSVAISGNYAIVGAYYEDDSGGADSGKAYIYNVTTGALVWTLNNPNAYSTGANDLFGRSVSISGNYAIVGVASEDDAGGTTSGKAYIFNVTTGALVWTLNNPNAYSTSTSDAFGNAVAISGNYAIVSAYLEDDSGGTSSGKAYIFAVNDVYKLTNVEQLRLNGVPDKVGNIGSSDQLIWTLDNPNAYGTSVSDGFGYSVSIDGNYAIVGAPNEADVGGGNSGKAYIFDVRSGALVWTLNNPNAYSTSLGDSFGDPVAISGNYAIVGAYQEDDAGGTISGKAYIFSVTTGALLWTLNNPNAYDTSANDYFAYALAISGNYAIVGAYQEDDTGGTISGKAYIFNVTTGALLWTLNNPNAYGTSASDSFGSTLAISDNYAIVGAYEEDSTTGVGIGRAYIFNVITGALLWTLNHPNGVSGDAFGRKVAISGNYALVSALGVDDSSGENSGRAYIFNVTTGALLWTLNNPNAYGASASDSFGWNVSLSGNYAVIGAYAEEGSNNEFNSGIAYVFSVNTGRLLWTLNNPSPFAQDYFGQTVSISNNYVIFGNNPNNDQKVYIFNLAQPTQQYNVPLDMNATGGYTQSVNYFQGAELTQTINNPNAYSTSLNDQFGYKVAISGNYAIASAWLESDASGTNSGKAYIFNVTTGALVWTLNHPNSYGSGTNDQFGWSVGISGNYAIVGAFGEATAHIFNVTTGALVQTLTNPSAYSTVAGDNFVRAVAISGNYAIVSASDEDDAGGLSSGKAYIFNVSTGALVWTLNNPNYFGTSDNDQFGYSVAISGNYAIVGALGEDAGGSNVGAYVFNVTTGALVYGLSNSIFPASVDISDTYAMVGAKIYSVSTGALLWTLNNPNSNTTDTNDEFGSSVAISGNYAIVGAYQEDDAGGGNSGVAYIFNARTGQLVWTLNNPNAYSTSLNDNFGYSVSLSGNYAIVSAYQEDDAGGTGSGKAYIYKLTDATTYVQDTPRTTFIPENTLLPNKLLQQSAPAGALLKTFDNPNAYSTSQDDRFGTSISISGNYAIVGTWREDSSGATESGRAYIYNVTTGALLWTLDNPNVYDTAQNDQFGASVAISGNYAIVGAAVEDDPSGFNSGKAYIYNVTTGQLVWTLNNPNVYSTSASDAFGSTLAISGNYAIVGASSEDDSTGTSSGKAYIFNVTTGALLWTLNNPNAYGTSDGDIFSSSLSISGNYAIVAARSEDDAGGTGSGKAYIYNVTTGALLWTLNNPNAYDTSEGDQFGWSVAIDGNYAIVGANYEEDSGGAFSGKAYIFNVTTGQLLWTLNNPNAYSTSASDSFGSSVAIDGNYAIVSANAESDVAGLYSGKAYIFNVTTGQLLCTLNNPNTYSTGTDDFFGDRVAISGNYAIVSANSEDDANGTSSGKAYLFAVRDLTYLDRLVQMVS